MLPEYHAEYRMAHGQRTGRGRSNICIDCRRICRCTQQSLRACTAGVGRRWRLVHITCRRHKQRLARRRMLRLGRRHTFRCRRDRRHNMHTRHMQPYDRIV